MAKEVTDPKEATGEQKPEEPKGVKFIKNICPHEKIKLPNGDVFTFAGATCKHIEDQALINGLRKVAKKYGIVEDPPYSPPQPK